MKVKKISIFIFSIIIFAVSVFIVGCQQDENELNNFNSDLEYLSINSDYTNLSQNDLKIVREAFQRFDISVEGGLFYIKQTSGSQVNVSESLFSIFKSAIDNTNIQIKNSSIKISRSKLRWSGEFSEDNNEMGTDCLAYTVSAALERCGVSMSVAEVWSWMVGNYGSDGIPIEEYSNVMDHFFQGSFVPIPPAYDFAHSAARGTVMIKRSGDQGHAVILIAVDGPNVVYQDFQNGGEYYTCTVFDIISLYNVYGANNI